MSKKGIKKALVFILVAMMVATSIAPSFSAPVSTYADAEPEIGEVELTIEDDQVEVTNEGEVTEQEANAPPEVVVPDVDYSSMRLMVKGDSVEGEPVIAEFDGVSLIQYETEKDAMLAYARLSEGMDVEVDKSFEIADEGGSGEVLPMTGESNPLTELETAIEGVDRIKYDVAVIDTGANDADKIVSMIGDDGSDNNGHGQAVIDTIKEIAPDAKILSIKAIGDNGKGDASSVYAAVKYAIEEGVKVINLSISAPATEDSFMVEDAIKEAISKGIIVVGAAGNNGSDASGFIPGRIEDAIIVGTDKSFSNTGNTVDYIVPAKSTSYASAKVAAYIAKNGSERGLEDFFANQEEITLDNPADIRVLVKTLYVDHTKVTSEDTFESVIYEKQTEPILFQTERFVTAYKQGDGSYKAPIDSAINGGIARGDIIDFDIARGNADGILVEKGASFDADSLMFSFNDEALEGIKDTDSSDIQIQIMVPGSIDGIGIPVTVENEFDDSLSYSTVKTFRAFEVPSVKVNTDVDRLNLYVYVDGKETNEYDYKNGAVTLSFMPKDISSINVVVSKTPHTEFEIAGLTKAEFENYGQFISLPDGTDVSALTKGKTWTETAKVVFTGDGWNTTANGADHDWSLADCLSGRYSEGAAIDGSSAYPVQSDVYPISISTNFGGTTGFYLSGVSATGANVTGPLYGTWNYALYGTCYHIAESRTNKRGNQDFEFKVTDKVTSGDYTYLVISFLQDTYRISGTGTAGTSQISGAYFGVKVKNTTVAVPDTPMVVKTNESGTNLAGAKFKLTGNGKTFYVTTNSSGVADFGNTANYDSGSSSAWVDNNRVYFPEGTYTLTEESAPSGYEKWTGSATLTSTKTTLSNGNVRYTLSWSSPAGTNSLAKTEIGQVEGTTRYNVRIGVTNSKYTIPDTPTVIKLDENGNQLKKSGAVFQITGPSSGGSRTLRVATDSNGVADFGQGANYISGYNNYWTVGGRIYFPAGTYTLTEVTPPSGYEKWTGSATLTSTKTSPSTGDRYTLSWNSPTGTVSQSNSLIGTVNGVSRYEVKIGVKNEPTQTPKLKITKSVTGANASSKAKGTYTFKLYAWTGSQYSSTVYKTVDVDIYGTDTTDYTLVDVAAGKYRVEETGHPTTVDDATGYQEVTVTSSNTTNNPATVNFVNTTKPDTPDDPEARIYKKVTGDGASTKAAGDYTFKLTKTTDSSKTYTFTVTISSGSTTGYSSWKKVEPGTYKVEETSCPEDVTLAESIPNVTLSDGDQRTITVNDVTFEEEPKESYIAVQKQVSVKDHKDIFVDNLPTSSTADPADIFKDPDKHSLEGAVFNVYRDAACTSYVGKLTTNHWLYTNTWSNGSQMVTAQSNTLEVAANTTYYIKEVTAPNGFQINTQVFSVTSQPESTSYATIAYAYVNEEPIPETFTGSLQVNKTVPTGHSAQGAKYGVYATRANAQAGTNPLTTLTITASGKSNLYTVDLESKTDTKTVYIKEISAPTETITNGIWTIDEEIHTATITANHTTTAPLVVQSEDGIVIDSFVRVKKVSANPSITNGNNCYSLAGGEFGVYGGVNGRNDAGNNTNRLALLTTKADGTTELSGKLDPGTYYIRELKAPKGYKLPEGSDAIKSIKLEAGEIGEVTFEDEPGEDPMEIVIRKVKKTGEVVKTITDVSATFKVEYFSNMNLEGNPTATWYFKTINGEITLDEAHLDTAYNNSPLYKDAQGHVTFPIGSVKVTEEKAPTGYIKDGAKAWTGKVQLVDNDGVFEWDNGSQPQNADFLAIENEEILSGITVHKIDKPFNTNIPEGDGTLAGTKIGVYSDNASVEVENKVVAKDGLIKIIETNEQGIATLDNILPIGKYYVKEIAAPEGYKVTDQKINFEITETVPGNDKKLDIKTSIANEPKLGSVKIEKWDAEKNAKASQGDADFSGIEFTITNKSKNPIKIGTSTIAVDAIALTITTNAAGDAQSEKVLPYGTYEIKETKTNGSYRLTDGTARTFTVREDGQVVDSEVQNNKLVFKNLVKRGGVKLAKVDLETGKSTPQGDAVLEGAEISIYNNSKNSVIVGGKEYAKGQVVTKLTTNATGAMSTTSEELPYGTYYAVETKPAVGYKQNTTWRVDFSVRDDKVVIDKTQDKLTQEVIRGAAQIIKKDANTSDGKPQGIGTFTGIRYALINRSKEAVKVNNVEYNPGEVCYIFTLPESGIAKTPDKAIPYGSYQAVELRQDATIALKDKYDGSTKLGTSVFVNDAGYLYSDETETLTIRKDGETATFNFENSLATGGVKVGKTDNDTKKASAQGNAVFAGAEFTVYNGNDREVFVDGNLYAKDAAIITITAGEDGTVETAEDLLPYGDYYVKETKAPTGYLLNTAWRVDFQIREYKVIVDTTTDAMKVTKGDKSKSGWYQVVSPGFNIVSANVPEKVQRGDAKIKKVDSEITAGQGDATFEGIRYAVVNRSNAPVFVDGAERAVGQVVSIVTLNASGDGTAKSLPFGKYDIVELSASAKAKAMKAGDVFNAANVGGSIYANDNGYLYKEKTVSVTIEKDGDIKTANFDNIPLRGGVKVGKIDKETGKNVPQSIAKLEGAEITIYNASKKPVLIDGKSVPENGEILTLTTDAKGLAQSENNILPYGTYKAKETKAPYGYALNEDWEVIFQIRKNGDICDTTVNDTATAGIGESAKTGVVSGKDIHETNKHEVPDQIMRTDLKFFKTDIDGKIMPNIPFLISRYDEKGKIVEQHVIVSDENGVIDTSAKDKNSDKTNSLDKYVKGGKFTDESKLDPTVNVWFGEQSAKNNTNGSLVYAQYLIEELQVEANKGMDLLKQYVFADGDNKPYEELLGYFEHNGVRDLSNVFVNLVIHPASDLIDDESDSKIATFGDVTVTDTFTYDHLKIDQNYKLLTEIFYIDRDGVKEKMGETMSEVWNPAKSDDNRTALGSIDNTVRINTTGIEGGTINAVDTLYGEINGEFVELTKHNVNMDVDTQIVYVPWMKTNASDVKTEDHVGTSLKNAEVIDIVKYENLGDQKMYLFRGELMDAETGEPIKGTDGKDLVVEKVLRVDWEADGMSEKSYGVLGPKDGEVRMPAFKLDGEVYKGKTVVVVETLMDYDTGKVILKHEDLADEDQSVHYPEASTEAKDVNTNQHTGVVGTTKVTDKVTIKNTIPGQEYTVKGNLVYQKDGTLADGTNFKKGDVIASHEGKTVVAEGTVTVVELTFDVDASKLEGVSGVVFEDVYHKDVLVAVHHDINDKPQTVNFPKVRTTAVDKDTKSHSGVVGKEAYIVDTVKLENLTEGENYKVVGTLMNTDGTVFKQDGKAVTVDSGIFTADSKDMTKELEFKFDSSLLAGQSLVVYEKLIHVQGTPEKPGKETEVARHEDPTDPDQTVDYPELHTNATDSKTADEVGTVGHEEIIIDKVTYENLRVGETYTITGDLHYKEDGEGHKAGDQVLDKEGNPYTAELTFTAEKTEGYVLLTYHVDSELLRGESVVVFEDLHNNGVKIHTHSDLEDKDQRIDYPEVKTTAYSKKTGDHVGDTDDETTIIDVVKLTNLTVGKKYTVTGVLMDKETVSPVLDADGKAVEASSDEFTATEKDMTIEIEFKLDGKARAAKTTVAYEQLIHNGVVVSYHCDIDDIDQSIFTPKIETNAMDAETDAQVGRPREETIIIDTVKYENLLPGMLYKVEGILMDQATGEAYIDADGKEVRSESQPFTVEEGKESGEIDIKFVFNGSNLKGTTVVVFEDLIHNGVTVTAHHDITDEKQSVDYPDGRTEAKDAKTETQMTNAEEKAKVIDTFYYTHLRPGLEYTLKGALMNKETGEKVAENEIKFVPEEKDGKVEIEFEFDASELKGKSLVAFETVLHKTIPVVVHEDLEDKDQTIYIPKIGTKAKDKEDSDNHILDAEDQVVVDTIIYENLIPNTEYHAYLTAYDKTTDELTEIEADRVFTSSETGSGEVDVEVTLDGTKYAGHILVFFEKVYVKTMDKPEEPVTPEEPVEEPTEEPDEPVDEPTEPVVEPKDYPVGVHEDKDDEGQTIYVPKIGTIAVDKADSDKIILARDSQTVVDTVKYEGLEAGREYTLKAKVFDKTANVLTDVEAERTFTPEEVNGEIEIEIPINGTEFEGHILVMYEYVSVIPKDVPEGETPVPNEVGRHEDPTDPDQTVNVPKIRTIASDKSDGDNIIYNKDKVTIVDTIKYEGLVPGKYKAVMTVMDKSTGKPLKSTVNDTDVTHTEWVNITEEDGEFKVELTIGSEITMGHTLVMFEELYLNGNLVGEHKDINDEPQTIYAPDAKTILKSSKGSKNVEPAEKTELVDTVKYTNLVPGKEYTLHGELISKATDKVIARGSAKFTASETGSGEAKVTFTLDTRSMAGKNIVAFETITYEENGTTYKVCEHKDKNDADQTIYVNVIKTTPKTGDTDAFMYYALLLALASCLVIAIRARFSRR